MPVKPHKKRFLITIFILILLTGLWLYNQLFMTTGSALKLAEDFLFSRMVVSKLDEQGGMRYFYVTNRQVTEDQESRENKYGVVREPTLKFGFYDTHIEPSVGLGMLMNPSEWFQNEEIRINQTQDLNQENFINNLRNVVNKSPDRSLLIMVHGYKEAFDSAQRKTAFVGYILDINSPVLLFDWPGNQDGAMPRYRRARRVATESGSELAKTLKIVVQYIKPDKIWLMANSMGAQVVSEASSLLYQDSDFSDGEFEFEDIILTAPDVNQEEFDQRFKQEMAALTQNLTVYVSSNDRALVMSRIVNRVERLGESNLSPDMLNEAVHIAKLIEDDSDLITLVDVTPVNRTRNFHNYSLETPEFFDDLYLRLTNDKTPKSRRLYGLQTPEGNRYWVLTPGR